MRRAIEEGLVDVGQSIEVGLRGSLYDRGDWDGLRTELGLEYLTTEDVFRLGPAAVAAAIRDRVGDRAGVHQLRHRRRRPGVRARDRHARGRRALGAGPAGDRPRADRHRLRRVRRRRGHPGLRPGRPDGDAGGEPRLRDAVARRAAAAAGRAMSDSTGGRRCRPGFRWPDGYRAAACFTFDADAESPILFEHPEAADWLDVMSHQAYGARAGIAADCSGSSTGRGSGRRSSSRATRPSARRRSAARSATPATRSPITATSTRAPTGPTREEQERRLLRGLEALDEVLGVRPTGYRAPELGADVRDAGVCSRAPRLPYDSGLMDADHPYVLATVARARRADDRRAARPLVARRLGAVQLPARDHRLRRDRRARPTSSPAGRSSSRRSSTRAGCSC